MRILPLEAGKKLRRSARCYYVLMNVLYAATFLLAFVPGFHPICTEKKKYPEVMNVANTLFHRDEAAHGGIFAPRPAPAPWEAAPRRGGPRRRAPGRSHATPAHRAAHGQSRSCHLSASSCERLCGGSRKKGRPG